MASRIPFGITRREFMGGMIGAVAVSSLPASARGLGLSRRHGDTVCSAISFRKIFCGVRQPLPIRSKARGTKMAKANPSGTASRTRQAWSREQTRAMSPAIPITATKKTLRLPRN